MIKINGKEYQHATVKVGETGMLIDGITAIDYQPIDQHSKSFRAGEASGTFEMLAEDWQSFCDALVPPLSKYWRRRAEHERRRDKRWERRHGVYPWGRSFARALRRAGATGVIVIDDEKADRVDAQFGALRDL